MKADCTKGCNFCDFLHAQLIYSGSTYRKEFAPRGAIFSLKTDSNRKGDKSEYGRVALNKAGNGAMRCLSLNDDAGLNSSICLWV